MRRWNIIKNKITACVMVCVMAASVIMVPAGKVQAEIKEVDLKPDTTETTVEASNGTVDVDFDVPDDYNYTSELTAAGLDKLQIKYIVISYTAMDGETAGAQPYVVCGEDWTSQNVWNNLSTNQEDTITMNLPISAVADLPIGKLGIQFANLTGRITYKILSAKLIGDEESSGSDGGDENEEDDTRITDNTVTASVYALSGGSADWTEYNYSVTNGTDSVISGIEIKIPYKGTVNGLKSFGCNVKHSGSYIIISHSKVIEAGQTYTCRGDNNIKFGFGGGATLGTPVVEFVYGTEGGGTSSSELKYELIGKTKEIDFADTPVGKHGKLQLANVDGYNTPIIVDKNGEPFQLRGASSHGIQWHDGYDFVNKGAYQSLRDEWGVNMVRLAAYVTQDGYTVGAKESMDEVIQRGVKAATDLGMYVIVDWHIHHENPHDTKSWAEDFFRKYATMYKDYDNVIFEICNEPTGIVWYNGSGTDLYSYCKDIATIIRDCDSDALIVCGTNTYSQDVEDVADKPLSDDGFDNILYTFHFYSATHYSNLMNKVKEAIREGTPLFVTEFGVCDADGNGAFDTANADEWIKLFDDNGVSYCCWSLSSKAESASYLLSSCTQKEGGWVESDLATTGIWLVNTYRAHQDAEEGIISEIGDFSLSTDTENGIISAVEEGYADPGKIIVTVTNTGSVALEGLEVSFGKGEDNTDFEIVEGLDGEGVLEVDESITIEISLKKDKTEGKYADSIVVSNGTIKRVQNISQTVTKKQIAPQGIDLKDTVSLTLNGEVKSEILTAKVIPEGANNTEISWLIPDNDVIEAAVDKNDSSKLTVTAVAKGKVTIIAKLAGTVTDTEIKKECVITVTEVIENTPGDDPEVENPEVENPEVENPEVENPEVENPEVENPEVENPEVENPEVENPEVENPEVENPEVENPEVENPEVENPEVENPEVENPEVENPEVENPEVENPEVENPEVENPEVENPEVENPEVENPDIEITRPYTIDISKLPGGSEYTDDDYLDNLYITYTSDVKTPTAVYEEGKLTLLLNTDYKLVGKNEKLTVSFRESDNVAAKDGDEAVILDGVTIKAVDADVPVKISGNTVIKEDVTADSVEILSGTINIGGSVNAEKEVIISSGTVTVEEGISATDLIVIKNGVKLTVNSAKKTPGSDPSAINSGTITIEDGAAITAGDNAKENLFSVVPKNQEGAEIDVSKYVGTSGDGNSTSGGQNVGGNDDKGGKSSDENKTDNVTNTANTDNKKEDTNQPQTVPAEQTADGNNPVSQVIKATDMFLTANVKGVNNYNVSETYQLAIKKSITLAVTFSPANASYENINIVSSNPEIVAVEGTKITAKKAGKAAITVTSDSGLTKTFDVKVMKKPVNKVKIKASKKTVKKGKTLKLKAVITPSKKTSNKIYWKSSNEKVAIVTQKGIVKGVKKGKVKITAIALDGSGKKATVKITVK